MPMGVLETTKACPRTSQQPLTMLNIVAADNAHQFSAQIGKQVCSVHHTIRVIVCVDGVGVGIRAGFYLFDAHRPYVCSPDSWSMLLFVTTCERRAGIRADSHAPIAHTDAIDHGCSA